MAEIALEDRLSLVAEHGDFSLAFSTAVQAGLHYFGSRDGYIAFRTKMGRVIAMADPVAPPEDHEPLIRQFVELAGDPCFVQVSEGTARILSSLGYKLNRFGLETRVSLSPQQFTGKRYETVRYSARWLERNGYAVREAGPLDDARDVHALSDAWRAKRILRKTEMGFINRPFRPKLEGGMRRFVLLDPTGGTVAFMDMDPVARGGRTLGYATAFKRTAPGATAHAEIGLTKHVCDRLMAEGYAFVELGLSPLAPAPESGFREHRTLRTVFHHAFKSRRVNRRVFNFTGQDAFKRRFHGETRPTFIGVRSTAILEIIALLRLCRLL